MHRRTKLDRLNCFILISIIKFCQKSHFLFHLKQPNGLDPCGFRWDKNLSVVATSSALLAQQKNKFLENSRTVFN